MPEMLRDAPVLPDACLPQWTDFLALHASRASTGFGPARISFADMDAYQRVSGTQLSAWEIGMIQSADLAFMASVAKK